jgi:hypothetical protein
MTLLAEILAYWSVAAIVACGVFACWVGRKP